MRLFSFARKAAPAAATPPAPTHLCIAHEHLELVAGDGFVDIRVMSAAVDDGLHVKAVRIDDRHVEALNSGLQNLRDRSAGAFPRSRWSAAEVARSFDPDEVDAVEAAL